MPLFGVLSWKLPLFLQLWEKYPHQFRKSLIYPLLIFLSVALPLFSSPLFTAFVHGSSEPSLHFLLSNSLHCLQKIINKKHNSKQPANSFFLWTPHIPPQCTSPLSASVRNRSHFSPPRFSNNHNPSSYTRPGLFLSEFLFRRRQFSSPAPLSRRREAQGAQREGSRSVVEEEIAEEKERIWQEIVVSCLGRGRMRGKKSGRWWREPRESGGRLDFFCSNAGIF